MPYEIDHIIAEQHGGPTDPVNLADSCLPCNRREGPNIASIDNLTNERVWLFEAFVSPHPAAFDGSAGVSFVI